jgi:hypothetical protein
VAWVTTSTELSTLNGDKAVPSPVQPARAAPSAGPPQRLLDVSAEPSDGEPNLRENVDTDVAKFRK